MRGGCLLPLYATEKIEKPYGYGLYRIVALRHK